MLKSFIYLLKALEFGFSVKQENISFSLQKDTKFFYNVLTFFND